MYSVRMYASRVPWKRDDLLKIQHERERDDLLKIQQEKESDGVVKRGRERVCVREREGRNGVACSRPT